MFSGALVHSLVVASGCCGVCLHAQVLRCCVAQLECMELLYDATSEYVITFDLHGQPAGH